MPRTNAAQEAPERERNREYKREEEHPLHERHYVVFGDDRPEQGQVEGEAEAVEQQEHDAGRAGGAGAAVVDRVQDQIEDAAET